MPILVMCCCGGKFRAQEQYSGQNVPCPKCGKEVIVDGPSVPTHDVFISYSSKDKSVGDAVCFALEQKGFRCWIAPRDIVAGKGWSESIIEGIEQCRLMTLVFSANANASQQVIREVERAVAKQLPIIPFRVENLAPSRAMEYFISSQHWLDAYSPPLEKHLDRLTETVEALLFGSDVAYRPGSAADPAEQIRAAAKSLHGRARLRKKLLGAGAALVVLALVVASVLWAMRPPPPMAQPAEPNSLGMQFVIVPAGEYERGSPDSDADASPEEKPRRLIRITQPFHLSVHEVTVGQFRAFVQATGYLTDGEKFVSGGGYDAQARELTNGPHFNWKSTGWPQSDAFPVVNVSWNDAKAFCDWLGLKEGVAYRLPTSAEWEYACRAGTTTRYYIGDQEESLQGYANLADQSLQKKSPEDDEIVSWDDGHPFAAPVGSFKPNRWGLYDMHGNVCEWTGDWHDPKAYKTGPTTDPKGPSSGETRVMRGGAWSNHARGLRSADRWGGATQDFRESDVGFRVVREPRY